MTVVVTGDSHAGVCAAAARLTSANLVVAPLGGARKFNTPFFELEGDEIRFPNRVLSHANAKAKSQLGPAGLLSPGVRLVVSMGLAPGPFYGAKMWATRDFGEAPDRSKTFVSSALLDRMIAAAQEPVIAFYRLAAERGVLAAAIAGPPPQRRAPAFRRMSETKVRELAERYERPVRAVLAELGCPVVSASGVVDADGFLLEEYWGEDWAHGNVAFGAKVLEELAKLNL